MTANISPCASIGSINITLNLPQYVTASSFGPAGLISAGCGVYTKNIVPLIIFQLLSVVNQTYNFRLTFSNGTIGQTGTNSVSIDVALNTRLDASRASFTNIGPGLQGVDHTTNVWSTGGGSSTPVGSGGGSTVSAYVNFDIIFVQNIPGFNNLPGDRYNFSVPGDNNNIVNPRQNKLTVVYIVDNNFKVNF